MARRMPSLVVLVTAAGAAIASTRRPAAQFRAEGPVALTVAAVEHLGKRLLQLGREGFRVDAVAVPDAPFVPDHVVVAVSQSPAGTTEYKVVDETQLWKLGEGVAKLADAGYVFRGLTVAKPRAPVGPMGYVVVMERSAAAAPSRDYRFVRTTGSAADWKVLEKAAADGFTMKQVYTRPDPVLSDRAASCADRRRNRIDAWLPCEAWRLRERLAGHATKNERVFDVRYHRDDKGALTVDVILRAEPPPVRIASDRH